MTKETKNIGELYKNSFEDYNPAIEDNGWLMLDMKLERNHFFRFSLTHFNIYYACMIAFSFLLGTGSIVNQFVRSRNTDEVLAPKIDQGPMGISGEENEQQTRNTGNNKGTNNITEKPSNINFQKDKSLLTNKNNNNSKEEGEVIENQTNSNSLKDSLINSITNSAVNKEENKEPVIEIKKEENKTIPKKKVMYITKQDTVIVMDTVKTRNKKKIKK